MIKETELRIGNWVDIKGEMHQCSGVMTRAIHYQRKTFSGESLAWLSELLPVSLTEELLINFDFKPNKDKDGRFEKDKFILDKNVKDMVVGRDNGFYFMNHAMKYIEIKSVHQLQNLYHALTGTELTIKQHA